MTPIDSLSLNHRKKKVELGNMRHFNQTLTTLLETLDGNNGEPDCEDKIKDFLYAAFYENTNAIAHIDKVDLGIYSGEKTSNSHPVVLIEVKSPSNKGGMPKQGTINCRGMQELVLYYVHQEFKDGNNDIRHLILTNGMEWYVFEKSELYKYFGKKTVYQDILRQDNSQNTEYVYERVIAPLIEKAQENIKCTYFSLDGFLKKIQKNPTLHSKELTAFYKLLSPTHLLEEPLLFDHTQLNRDFYTELLYIMGLHEVEDKKVGLKIVRFDEEERQPHTLIEDTISTLRDVRPCFTADEVEDIALGLVLTWTSRVLFVKLLEGLLGSFDEGFGKILVPSRIKTFHRLDDLFTKVLAKTYDERSADVADFAKVPYLNSSLFEYTDLEVSSIRMRELHQGGKLKPFAQTRLHNDSGGKLTESLDVLEYLLRFLDAYDFSGSEDADEATIINASVLGKIFEKINGYKDGAFFTPSMVSEYMCRLVIRKAVVDKFNSTFDADYASFEELKEHLDYHEKETRRVANNIINNVRVCDPSVGSGHFLVSALNELLVIKSELGILQYYNDNDKRASKDFHLAIDNGVLTVKDLEHGDSFSYKRQDGRTLPMQRTLFMEKRTLIENCLFGADLNPKSVDICRLRLWIELLKNAYYDENDILQTLPNIDINIQCGDSLLSMYEVECGKRCLDVSHAEYIEDYMSAVREYKNCDNKHTKVQLAQRIEKRMRAWTRKPKLQTLFDMDEAFYNEERKVEWMLAFPDVMKADGTFEGFDVVIGNPPYINISALDKDTIKEYFEHSDENKKAKRQRRDMYHTFSNTADIYSLFFERGIQLLQQEGYLCFITSRKWMRNDSGIKTREFLTSKTNPLILIDMPGVQFFEKATVETDILMVRKECPGYILKGTEIAKKSKDMFSKSRESLLPLRFEGSEPWVIKSDDYLQISHYIRTKCKSLAEYRMSINMGIKSGNNDAFFISSEQRNYILELCKDEEERRNTKDLMQPLLKGENLRAYSCQWSDIWVISLFPARKIDIEKYPAIKTWLQEFERTSLIAKGLNEIADKHLHEFCQQRLEQKGVPVIINGSPVLNIAHQPIMGRKKTSFKWYEIQDSVAFWQDMSKPKIIWGEISNTPKFYFDEKGEYFSDISTFFMTGEHIVYLLCYLNSPLSRFLFEKIGTTTGQGTLRWLKYKINQLPVPDIDADTERQIENLYHQYTQSKDESLIEQIYQTIYNFLELTPEQIEIIKQTK